MGGISGPGWDTHFFLRIVNITAHRDGMWENKITTRDSVVSALVPPMCPEGLAKLIT